MCSVHNIPLVKVTYHPELASKKYESGTPSVNAGVKWYLPDNRSDIPVLDSISQKNSSIAVTYTYNQHYAMQTRVA